MNRVKSVFLLITLCAYSLVGSAQKDTIIENRESRYLIWSYHEEDVKIYGLSLGLYSTLINQRNTTTNGIRLELLGSGILDLFGPPSYSLFHPEPVKPKQEFYERVNGISISPLGLIGEIDVNGIGVTALHSTQNRANGFFFSLLNLYAIQMNGISIAMFENGLDRLNGVSISGVFSRTHTGNGLQICVLDNFARRFNGVQIGLWNVTETGNLVQFGLLNYIKSNPKGLRILPIMNFQFGKRKSLEEYDKKAVIQLIDPSAYQEYQIKLETLKSEQKDSLQMYLDLLPTNRIEGEIFAEEKRKDPAIISKIFSKISEACLNENEVALSTLLLASEHMIKEVKDPYYGQLSNILIQKQFFFCDVYNRNKNPGLKNLQKFLNDYGRCQ